MTSKQTGHRLQLEERRLEQTLPFPSKDEVVLEGHKKQDGFIP
jgi:hypothetical protein